MRKITIVSAILMTLVGISGFGYTEISEYLQVARNNVKESIKGQISNDVELDRMEVIIHKLDLQISKQKFKVAEVQVGCENADKAWQDQVEQSNAYLSKMSTLREIQKTAGIGDVVRVGCQKVSIDETRAALAYQLQKYKACQEVCGEKAKLMEAQKLAVDSLTTSFDEMRQQRDLLAQKVELLRSRNEVQKTNRELTSDQTFDPSELQRAKDLAAEIENRLEIAEKVQSLDTDPTDKIIQASELNTNLESEVDQLLKPRANF